MQARVKIPAKLVPLFEGTARYRVAYGGRGSGKSVSFARMALVTAGSSNIRILCARELQNSIKDSVHNLLVSEINALGLQHEFEYGESFIRHKNGSEFIFKGLRSNANEIKSMNNIGLCWVEEAQSISNKSLELLLPTIRAPNSEIWFTFNPEDEDDPVYKQFVVNQPDDAKVVKINWQNNPWFPPELDRLRLSTQKIRPERYDYIWEGNFNINTEGAIYAKWINQRETAGAFMVDLYDPALPVHTAWDIGYSDYTTIWFYQTIAGEIRLIDYYENNREGIQHYAGQLLGYEFETSAISSHGKILYKRGAEVPALERRRSYRYGKHWVPHDAAHKLFAANGRSIIEQADDFGIRMYVMPAIAQQSQIQLARATISQCWFDPNLCADGIRALRKYEFQFDEDKQRYKDDPFHNWASHGADAFELLAQVQKQPILEKEKPEPLFWHDSKSSDIFFPKTVGRPRERI